VYLDNTKVVSSATEVLNTFKKYKYPVPNMIIGANVLCTCKSVSVSCGGWDLSTTCTDSHGPFANILAMVNWMSAEGGVMFLSARPVANDPTFTASAGVKQEWVAIMAALIKEHPAVTVTFHDYDDIFVGCHIVVPADKQWAAEILKPERRLPSPSHKDEL